MTEDEICPFIPPGEVPAFLRCYEEDEIFFKTARYLSFGDFDCDFVDTPASTSKKYINEVIEIYPNPTQSHITLNKQSQASESQQIFYSITDSQGQVIRQSDFFELPTTIDIQELKAGLYFLNLENEKGHRAVERIIKH